MLTVAGLHVPATPLSDVVGRVGTLPPEQMERELPKLKFGMVLGVTFTVNVAAVAHKPAVGVNV